MGESAAQTVKDIERIRGRLDEEVAELQRRLPAPAVWGKRILGAAAGGGAGGTLFAVLLRRNRKRREKREREEVARHPLVTAIVPAEAIRSTSQPSKRGGLMAWAAAAGGVWLGLRIAELLKDRGSAGR